MIDRAPRLDRRFEMHLTKDAPCIITHVRRNYSYDHPFGWEKVLKTPRCFQETSHGPVANFDGELILDNPRFLRPERNFSMSDVQLVVDDITG